MAAAQKSITRVDYMKFQADTMPSVPKAGLVWNADCESSAQALSYQRDSRNVKPPSPVAIKKYRKSFQQQPGLRLIHVGSVQDKSPYPEYFRHGIRTETGDSVMQCMSHEDKSELQNYHTDEKEKFYRSRVREPLGQSYTRGHVFPGDINDRDFAFGKSSTNSEPAKSLIYYKESIPDKRARSSTNEQLPLRNPEREITRQINRNYNWKAAGIDPEFHRFGKSEPVVFNGVKHSLTFAEETKVASRRQQQVRSVQRDRLGKGREVRGALRNLGADFIFGRVDNPDEWGVKKCITGEYNIMDQLPDRDLGISTKRLSKLELVPDNPNDRAYGIPSIRFDLPPPAQRSVADPQNYGNESHGKGLLYPGKFAMDGVDDEDFIMVRPKEEIRAVFTKVGVPFTDAQFERLCEMAERDFGGLSCDSFRHALNKHRMDSTQSSVLSPLHQKPGAVGGF